MASIENIKPELFWYISGYIVADGNLSKDGRHIIITSKDRDHLKALVKSLGIDVVVGKKARGGSSEKIYSYIQISSTTLYRQLLNIGLTPNKSLTLKNIKISSDYFPHFLRGVIDGDGCIATWVHNTNKKRQWSLRITSAAPIFSKWLKEEIELFFDVRGKLHTVTNKTKQNPVYVIKFGKLATRAIISKTYTSNSFALKRKHQKAILCLQDNSRVINYSSILGPGAGIGRQD